MSQKNRLQPWRTKRFCIAEKDRAVRRAEGTRPRHLLRILRRDAPADLQDEAAKQVVADVEPALPMTPGQSRCEDHHYQRKGVQAIFAFFNPLAGWRRISSRDSRTRRDWAEEVRRLLEVDCPDAELVTLVCDNLNTHDVASLYQTFPAATAHRLARRLRIIHTPRNGSWLNMAEIELSVLTRQCLGRRFDSIPAMRSAIAAWQRARNTARHGAQWRFTTQDARIQLRSLYPQPEVLR